MAANYTELQAEVASWTARSDLAPVIPSFIAAAEAVFNRTLRTRQMEQRAIATAAEYIALPDDFMELRNIQISGDKNYVLEQRSPYELDALHDGSTGRPARYCLLANQIQLAPAPDSTYTLEIDYWMQLPALASNATNWLLTAYPDAYLYGALMSAAGHLMDDGRIPLWRDAYAQVITQIQNAERRARWSGSPLYTRAG